MDFGFLSDPDATRNCYLRLRVLKEAIDDPKILDALVVQLEVPGKRLSSLSADDKLAAVERQIDHFSATKTSVWYGVPAQEILAASIFRANNLSERVVEKLFSDVPRESDLATPVIRWLNAKGLTPYEEVPLGTKRIDVVGFKKQSFFGDSRVVGVELKNDRAQLKRALDQMTTFAEYLNAMYLACTPFLAAGYLDAHAEAPSVHHWDAGVFRRKLEAFGFGLLLVEGDAVYEWLAPKERSPESRKLKEFTATIKLAGAARG